MFARYHGHVAEALLDGEGRHVWSRLVPHKHLTREFRCAWGFGRSGTSSVRASFTFSYFFIVSHPKK